MKANRGILIWGIALILVGGLILAQNLGWIGESAPSTWAMVFGCLSLLSFVTFFLGRHRAWCWLFPAFAFAGVAATMALVNAGADDTYLGTPVFAGIGATFGAVWLHQNKAATRWAKYPAAILLAVGVLSLVFGERMQDYLLAAAVISLGL